MLSQTFIRSALLAALAAAGFAQDRLERYYQVIRGNEIAALHALVKSGNVDEKDKHGTTPLHYAAAYGSVESVRILLEAGANVNARNDFDATPLMWCPTELDKIKLLVAKGADVNAKSKMGRTAIWIAASNDGSSATVRFLLNHGAKLDGSEIIAAAAANDMTTIHMLLEKGVDVNVHNQPEGLTPLILAAMNRNPQLVALLLAKGADVNAASTVDGHGTVKTGKIAIGLLTPLLVASTYGPADLVKTLLDAGANINSQDVRKMTPLMFAVATDHPDVRTVRLLLERGADTKIQDGIGLTAADWARKMNSPVILHEFGLKAEHAEPTKVVIPASLLGTGSPRPAVAKSIDLLQRASGSFFKAGGCGACHAANLTSIAVNAAWTNHIPVNEAAKAGELKGAQLGLAAFEQPLLQRNDPPVVEIVTFSVLQLASENLPADRTTDAMIHNIMAQQHQAGYWHMGGIARPPAEDGDISRTATGIRAIALYAPKAEARRRIDRAAAWLAAAPVRTNEDLAMQLAGLKWAGAPRRVWLAGMGKLIGQQREDGGWGQTADLPSDAYATGEALYVLHELGVPATDATYQRGVQYLLRTQQADGSWRVKSRAPKIQPYFDTIFPYGDDQWISSWATAWSAAALSYAAGPEQIAKR